VTIEMRLGRLEETVTVTGEAPLIDTQSTTRTMVFRNDIPESRQRSSSSKIDTTTVQTTAPSQNVINLQQRTTGVLPVRVDVPRAGTSHQFIKPLVVDQETRVTLRYKRR
jgi:hypothetical protein